MHSSRNNLSMLASSLPQSLDGATPLPKTLSARVALQDACSTPPPESQPHLADIALIIDDDDEGFDMSGRDAVAGFTPLLTSSPRAARGALANPSRVQKGGFEGRPKDSDTDVVMTEGEVTRQEIHY